MASIIKIKSSETINKIPQAADLQVAELAINLADQKIYSKKSNGSVIPLGANGWSYPTADHLRAITTPTKQNLYATTLGALTQGDGGGGEWYWDSVSTEDDNTGTVLTPNNRAGAGRWKRMIPNNTYNVAWFGAKGDDTTDDAPAFREAATALNSLDEGSLYIPSGIYKLVPTSGIIPDASNSYGLNDPDASVLFLTSKHVNVFGDGIDVSIIKLYGPGGGLAETDYEVNGGNVYRGHLLTFSGGDTEPLAQSIRVHNLSILGTSEFTGDHSFPADPGTGNGWDLTNKGVSHRPNKFIQQFRVENCEIGEFKGELLYSAGANARNISFQNNHGHTSNAEFCTCGSGTIINNRIQNCVAGIEVVIAEDQSTTVIGNELSADSAVTGDGISIRALNAANTVQMNATLKNNSIRSHKRSLVLLSSDSAVISGNNLFQNDSNSLVIKSGDDTNKNPIHEAFITNNTVVFEHGATTSPVIISENNSVGFGTLWFDNNTIALGNGVGSTTTASLIFDCPVASAANKLSTFMTRINTLYEDTYITTTNPTGTANQLLVRFDSSNIIKWKPATYELSVQFIASGSDVTISNLRVSKHDIQLGDAGALTILDGKSKWITFVCDMLLTDRALDVRGTLSIGSALECNGRGKLIQLN
jgi:hypothetical protein